MGNNKPIDKLIVQKVFEMIRADKSHSQIADFYHHSRPWVQHVLRTDSLIHLGYPVDLPAIVFSILNLALFAEELEVVVGEW